MENWEDYIKKIEKEVSSHPSSITLTKLLVAYRLSGRLADAKLVENRINTTELK